MATPRRFRCTACGNLTRFTVTVTQRTRSFHHFTLGGDVSIEDEEVLDERLDEVACRWCGATTGVEVIDAPAGEPGGAPAAGSAERS